MRTIKFILISLFLLACGGENKGTSTTDLTSGSSEQSKIEKSSRKINTNANTIILIKAGGESYSINSINQENSYLKFYSADSDMNHDADFEIVSSNKEERLTVIIDGLDGKGKDNLSGDVHFSETASLVTYKKGNLSISFTKGKLNVEEVSKASGLVKLKANGLCTIKKGNSFADMKVDIPAQLEVTTTISDVKTLNYKK